MTKLIKLSIVTLALVLVSTLAVTNVAMAQDDVTLDETVTAEDLGVLAPSSGIFGFLKNVGFGIKYALTFNPVKKAELKLNHASQALLAAATALENKPDDVKAKARYDSYLEKYEKRMDQLQQQVQNIKDKAPFNEKIETFMNKVYDSTFKQQRLMDHANSLISDEQRAKLMEARENSLKTLGEAIKNLDDVDKLPERLETALNMQDGSRLIHLKNLEVLHALESQVPDAAIKGIKNAEEQSIHRLNAALQNLEPEARIDRFHTYMDGSNSDPLVQLQALEALEDDPTTLHDIRGNIPALKNDKVERLNEVVDMLQDDPHNVRYIERVREHAPEAVPTTRDTVKEGVRESVHEGTIPERVEGGRDKVKDTRNLIKDQNLPTEIAE